jgi:hypothetical protein
VQVNQFMKIVEPSSPAAIPQPIAFNDSAIPGLKVYPVPFKDMLTVVIPELYTLQKIELFDIQGKKIKPPMLKKNNYLFIDCSNLDQSIYLMRISTNNISVIKKLIKEK